MRREEPVRGRRITGAERDELAVRLRKEYERGATVRALAGQLGRSYGFVHRVLSESGVPLRSRGGLRRRGTAPARSERGGGRDPR